MNARSLDGLEIPDIYHDDESEHLIQQMMTAINDMNKIDKSIMLLYLDSKSYDEISEITGLSKSNVGVKINRLKSKLSNVLIK